MKPRVELQAAYVLHTRPYRETSLLLDCFTQEYGKISLIAKGARRLKSPQKGILRPFMPLLISFIGRSELKTLTHCELRSTIIHLSHERLAHSFYLNELLVRLLHPQMPFPEFFDFYERTLQKIAEEQTYAHVLRLFEKQLLQTLGYELILHQDRREQAVKAERYYLYLPEQGLSEVDPGRLPNGRAVLQGKTLLALANEDLKDAKICNEAKFILQAALKRLLGDKPIRSQYD